jgi:signal transduction histidine kinase/ActR/RegA family two-component response regulator
VIPHLSERALILAPQGRDAVVARAMLQEAGLRAVIINGVNHLVDEIDAGAGFALLTEESLAGADLAKLAKWLERQPEWSDFPFVLLTQRGGGLERNPSARRYLEVLGNVTFLERPFHPTTLVSLAQSALRGRRRQYDARARLEELNELAVDLERRVEEKTAERETAMAQLHEAQKLETIGQLTGGVAHDFNNLLTPIIGVLDLLHRTYAEQDERAGRLISNALQAADRAKTLVQRLLGFARRQALQTQAVDLNHLLGGMRDLIASSIGPTIEIHLRCEPDLSPALVDPNQLELAILNLCVNARDAMSDGGALTILAEEVAIGPRSDPKLKPGLYVRLSVIDAGCGMDAATLAHAVEPFYSTKEVGRGTGLGLSMVHGLAAQLGGGFSLSSEIGEGTRADLYLPVAEEKALRHNASVTLQIPAASRRLSILLVDDEPLVRTGTAEMIRDLGHQVRDASGGFEALAILAEGDEFDVIVTDYKMPGMDGAELAEKVRKVRPDAAILLITGYTGTGEAVANLPRLSKPFGQAEIAAALGRLFDASETVIKFPSRKRPTSV